MAEIEVKRINRKRADIRIVGTAPLIVHRFSEKAKQAMLDNMQGHKPPKESRDPEKDFRDAAHLLEDGRHGFPATGFKAAIVSGARYFNNKSLSMTLLRQSLFVLGEGESMLIPLICDEPQMREDYVRMNGIKTDLRYRPAYWPWAAVISVLYIPSLLNLQSVLALVEAGGMGGIGEWRPASRSSNTGVYGTFQIDTETDVKEMPA